MPRNEAAARQTAEDAAAGRTNAGCPSERRSARRTWPRRPTGSGWWRSPASASAGWTCWSTTPEWRRPCGRTCSRLGGELRPAVGHQPPRAVLPDPGRRPVDARAAEPAPPRDYLPQIVNITSVSAYTASVNRGEYCIAKAGLAMMTNLYRGAPGGARNPRLRGAPGRSSRPT